MKRRTLWIIGISTAIITSIGLHTAFGGSYHPYKGICSQHQTKAESKAAENKTVPVQ